MPVHALHSGFRLANWATYPIVLLSIDRNLRAVAAKSPADAARLQQEERLRIPVSGDPRLHRKPIWAE